MVSGDAAEMQRLWYGEPLGELFGRLIDTLGLNQARLAAVLGLSAPMLSQLMNGRRAKIGNPVVVRRMQELQELAERMRGGLLGAEQAAAELERIRAAGTDAGTYSSGTGLSAASGAASSPALPRYGGTPPPVSAPPAAAVVREIQGLLRSVASAGELIDVATRLAAEHPDLAEFLRVYGAGRTDEAVAHYRAHLPR